MLIGDVIVVSPTTRLGIGPCVPVPAVPLTHPRTLAVFLSLGLSFPHLGNEIHLEPKFQLSGLRSSRQQGAGVQI